MHLMRAFWCGEARSRGLKRPTNFQPTGGGRRVAFPQHVAETRNTRNKLGFEIVVRRD